jgi:hypothetical protein
LELPPMRLNRPVTAPVILLDPLFADAAVADAFERRGAEYGAYRLYAEHEQIELEIGPGLLPRHDAVRNFLSTRVGASETVESVGARTSYFREEYAYGDRLLLDGVEVLRDHEGLIDAARRIHDRPVIEPAIVYANLFLPGQELAVHTDVPEFRGLSRKQVPQWLLVVMHHSGLFDAWRLPIATGIAWFGAAEGGALAYWPDGPDGDLARLDARHNTAAVLDTDSVFHGVEPVGPADAVLPSLAPGSVLGTETDGRIVLCDADGRPVRAYAWGELRYSVSWKAYCFVDAGARDTWRDHTDDLELASVLDALIADLRRRGDDDLTTSSPELGSRLIDEYVRFPNASRDGVSTRS